MQTHFKRLQHPKRLQAALAAAIALAFCGPALAQDAQGVAQREVQRLARLRDASPGTVDFCSVVRLTDEPTPLARDAREVTCHFNFGTTSLAELEGAGWEVTNMTNDVNRNRWGYHTSTLAITVRKKRPAPQV